MESFLNGLRRFGIGRLAAVIGAAAGAAAILVAAMMNLGGEPKALLYSNLDLKEASEITAALDQAGVKYEAKGDGSTIMVDRDTVASTRLMLSSKGLPTSGSVGYELFDNASIMGQTEFTQNLNKQRALEGELARTIRSLQGVTSARVHLVLPKRELFEEEAAQPTASVVVGLGGGKLSADHVRSLRNLVAGAVPGLKPDHVTVVDESGEMLAAGAEGEDAYLGALAGERKTETEERIRRAVKSIVEGVVGPGKARVEVTAELDLNRVTTQEERFDPDGQVVRSTRTSESNQSETDPGSDGSVTATANLPEGQQQPGFLSTSSSAGQSEEITNYEISKTVRTEVVEPGQIKRLSVAVAVDGVTAAAAGGKPGAYTPRTAAEMQQIEQLVRSAVGYDQDRGDQLSVVNVRFNRPSADEVGGTAAGAPMFAFDKNDLMRGVELGILAVVAALIIFFVVRPMLKTAEGPVPGSASIPVTALQPAGGPGQALAYEGGHAALPGPSEMDHRIDIARIEGQVKASSVKKVSEFVGKHPEESASILRTWLHES